MYVIYISISISIYVNTEQYQKSGVNLCRKTAFVLLKLSLYKIKFDCYDFIMRNINSKKRISIKYTQKEIRWIRNSLQNIKTHMLTVIDEMNKKQARHTVNHQWTNKKIENSYIYNNIKNN